VTSEAAPDREQGYSLGYSEPALRELLRRGVDEFAGFLLPHLRPGMRLLDVGAGPGTITLGLANAVAPGEVVGIDIDSVQVERARSLAAEHQVVNVRFQTGDAYAEAKSCGTPDTVRRKRELLADRVDQIMRPRAIEQGRADAATIDAIIVEMRASVVNPDTFFGAVWCAAVGWVDA
jgi:SAM-dependent methyltransferase